VEEYPDAAVEHKAGLLLAGGEGGNEPEKKDDGEDEDAERDGLVSPVDDEKGSGENKRKKDFGNSNLTQAVQA